MASCGKVAAVLGALLLLGGAKGDETVKGWIALEGETEWEQRFVAYASADRTFLGQYELSGEKQSRAGQSRVQQAGRMALSPGAPVRLSQLSFGRLQDSDRYTVRLRLLEEGRLVQEVVLAQ